MTDKETLIKLFKGLGMVQVDALPAIGQYLDTGEYLITGSSNRFMIDKAGKCVDMDVVPPDWE